MHSPCITRRIGEGRRDPGATASKAVGIESSARLATMPSRRSIRWLNSATASPDTAMPKVEALTATPMAEGVTP